MNLSRAVFDNLNRLDVMIHIHTLILRLHLTFGPKNHKTLTAYIADCVTVS